MAQVRQQSQWKGNVHAVLKGPRADKVWPMLEDFFNLHKWFPTLSTAYGLEGANGEPGCVRYCAGSSIPSKDADANVLSWSSERLVAIDPEEMVLSYEMVSGNIGFESYTAIMKLLPRDDGCLIMWSFMVDPVKGWKFEDLIAKFQQGLDGMAKGIEENFLEGN